MAVRGLTSAGTHMEKYIITSSQATPGLEEFLIPLVTNVIRIWKEREWTIESHSIVIPSQELNVIADLLQGKYGKSNIFCNMLLYKTDKLIVTAVISPIGLMTATIKILPLTSLQDQAMFQLARSIKYEEDLTQLHIPVGCKSEISLWFREMDNTVEIFPFKDK